jgi:hypothetical protein
MWGHGHLVDKAPTGHEAISCVEREFTQLLGRRFCTAKDPYDKRLAQAFSNLGRSLRSHRVN